MINTHTHTRTHTHTHTHTHTPVSVLELDERCGVGVSGIGFGELKHAPDALADYGELRKLRRAAFLLWQWLQLERLFDGRSDVERLPHFI